MSLPRRRRDPQATRARLLRAATQEFARHGLAGARGERIARRASSSERMLYYYYGSKEGLYRTVLEAAYLELRGASRALTIDSSDPEAALDAFCRFVWRFYVDHPEFIGLVSSENQVQARFLRRSSQLGDLVSPVVSRLRELLEHGCRQQVFRDGIDARELYIMISALGYFYLSNQHTLSAVLDSDLRPRRRIEEHWAQSLEMVRRYVLRSNAQQ